MLKTSPNCAMGTPPYHTPHFPPARSLHSLTLPPPPSPVENILAMPLIVLHDLADSCIPA